MEFFIKLISLILLHFSVAEASHSCTAFDNVHHGYGCDLSGVNTFKELKEINMMTKETNRTNDDIQWIQIRNSAFDDLSKLDKVFAKFKNLRKVFISGCIGFKNLDKPFLRVDSTLVFMKESDLEVLEENAFKGLVNVDTVSLNNNQINKIHKNIFSDLEKVNYIEMNKNKIATLDEDIFAKNLNLQVIDLSGNQITVISSRLFSRNINLGSLLLQSNAISQIEKNFNQNLTYLRKVDLTSNDCINESINVTLVSQWNSFKSKFNECNKNFAMMQSERQEVNAIKNEMVKLKEKIDDAVERVNNDIKDLEGKMNESTAFANMKTDLLQLLRSDQDAIRKEFVESLNNVSSHVHSATEQDFKKEFWPMFDKSQENQSEKLLDENNIREEFDSKLSKVYFTFFASICLLCVAAAFFMRKFRLLPTLSYHEGEAKLLASEIC